MKPFLKIKLFFFATAISCSLFSNGQLVKKIEDLKKLDSCKQKYVGKSLKFLLEDIEPQIITVQCSPVASETPAYFLFFFKRLDSVYLDYSKKISVPSLDVYINKSFTWRTKAKNQSRFDYYRWTKKDIENYGDLIILGLQVNGLNK